MFGKSPPALAGALVLALAGVAQSSCSSSSSKETTEGDAAAGSAGMSSGATSGSGGNTRDSGAGGTNAGAAGLGGTSGGTAGSAGTNSGEQCGNGSDDDGDGKIDCADDECGQSACLTGAPNGWSGPVWLASAPGENAPGCTAGLSVVARPLHGQLDAPKPSCDCTCSGKSGCTWTGTSLNWTNCDDGNVCYNVSAPENECVEVAVCPPPAGKIGAFRGNPVVPTQSTCTPSISPVPPRKWNVSVSMCSAGTAGGGCAGGAVCVGQAPVGALACIYQPGQHACPPGPYSQVYVYHESVTDTRSCSPACSCSAKCSTTLSYWVNGTTCTGTPRGTTNVSSCMFPLVPDTGTETVRSVKYGVLPCQKTIGTAVGAATLNEPTTLCCAL